MTARAKCETWLTEPAAGSDLQGIKTTAVRDGDDIVINGQKVFITNGQLADLVIVVAKTDPAAGAKGTSLVLVERGREGFDELAQKRALDVVTFRDWQRIEEAEIAAARSGAPREKFVDIESMIAARGA